MDADFVILSTDSNGDYLMSLLDRAETPELEFARQVSAAAQQCGHFRTQLMEQRRQLEKLRGEFETRLGALREREGRLALLERQLEAERRHFATQEASRRELLTDQLTREAQTGRLTSELQQAREEAKTAKAEMSRAVDAERLKHRAEVEELKRGHASATEAERTKFLTDLAALNDELKRLRQLCESSNRLTAEMEAAAAAEINSNRLETQRQLKRKITELEEQLAEERAKRRQAEAESTELRQAQEVTKRSHRTKFQSLQENTLFTCLVFVLKFAHLSDVGATHAVTVSTRPRCSHRVHRPAENTSNVTAEETPELPEALRLLAKSRNEVAELKVQQRQFDARIVEFNRTVSTILEGTERFRLETQAEIAALRCKVARDDEALRDYAEKMMKKAEAEFLLKERLRACVL